MGLDHDHLSLLRLTLVRGLGPTTLRRCLEAFGSPDAVLGVSAEMLSQVQGVGPRRAQTLARAMADPQLARRVDDELAMIERYGVQLLAVDDAGYPALLRHIPDPPPLLYVRGQLVAEDALGLGIVGSRKCTAYGREQADRFAGFAAQAGLCIVSGGARGIDGAAHRAALRLRRRTIAVIGSGLARPYPADHAELFDQIVAEGAGAVISELPMTAPPAAENFPRRNRIISGLSLGVLVVEAALRSGALITARLAAEEHHREVMAIPGRVDSKYSAGCHKILRDGWAALVTSGVDVLDCLGEAGQMLRAAAPVDAMALPWESKPSQQSEAPQPATAGASGDEQKLLAALASPLSLDQLVESTGLPAATVQAQLTMLQVRGQVVRDGGLLRRKG